jgi:pimeloyl-ACP methyl ester carboxylesterase
MLATQTSGFQYSRPSKLNSLLEARAPFEWLNTALQFSSFQNLPKGDGRPIVLAPGYLADKLSMRPLKVFLERLGYDVYDWDLGRNLGDVDADIERLNAQIDALYSELGQPITLLGWSLGGVVARESTRLRPQAVREVITLGTPITGGPKYTSIGPQYAKLKGIDMDSFEEHVLARNQIGFKQPVTSIFSKGDGVVGWEASVDTYNEQAKNIEVSGSHLGLGCNAQVWRIIAYLLADS